MADEGPADLPYCYLTTTGRTTGRDHRIEIWFAMHEGTLYLLSGDRGSSDWVRNLVASPEVTLELGGETRRTVATVVDAGTDEDGLARRLVAEKYQPGYGDDLSTWARTSLVVAVVWDVPG
jgi:deazaflavin-dependent oxidoreductase (nitroreductase family)